MQFEKIFINDMNGKVSGYHQKGKYEDGEFKIYYNEKINKDDLMHKRYELSDKSVTRPKSCDCNLVVNNNKCDCVNMSDADFIRLCESKINDNKIVIGAKQLRKKLRQMLEIKLDKEILADFKLLVNIMDHDERNEHTEKIVNDLIQKYN